MGNRPTAPRLTVAPQPASTLNFDEMALAPPETMALVEARGTAYDAALPWPAYVLDSWLTPALECVMLSPPLARIALTARSLNDLLTGKTNAALLEELRAAMDPGRAYFVRTSMCSTKVGARPCPANCPEEVLAQILASPRCKTALATPNIAHSIWLMAWEDECNIEREFRVFVKDRKVVAIGPYYCAVDLPWMGDIEAATTVGQAVLRFFDEHIVGQISFEEAVMDIIYMETGEVRLIEFNPLLTSGGGLFSWITDRNLLAGKEKNVVMRFVVNDY